MDKRLRVMPGRAYPLGLSVNGDDICISACFSGRSACGISFYNSKTSEKANVLFDESCRTGSIYSAVISGARGRFDRYLLYENGHSFVDPYARKIYGLEQWGQVPRAGGVLCGIEPEPYDWSGDIRPLIPYHKSVFYSLHVRSFTQMPGSGVPKSMRGTFRGLSEKIPYLQSLGVTAVELMPIMEVPERREHIQDEGFAAKEASAATKKPLYVTENGTVRESPEQSGSVNLWGFQKGYYFAPCSAYAFDKAHADTECKDMIRAFHENGMEVILQFYFAQGTNKNLMIECIRYWVSEYHIDGIHLKSVNIPTDMIVSDPMLRDIKILTNELRECTEASPHPNLARFDEVYPFAARRFLKSDDNSVAPYVDAMLLKDAAHPQISYICSYDGFSLRDLVSYDHKHNEANGEGGRDGRDDNCSWNCGEEGKSRKKSVLALRRRQMLNALTMVFLSQGTPLLHAGDEMGNSREGNNNAWCQDNKTGWTTWDTRGQYAYLTDYVRFLTRFRKEHPYIASAKPFRMIDTLGGGYPDVSFHGVFSWQPDFNGNSHAFGVLYCGLYDEAHPSDTYVYVIYNMFWKEITFQMPVLPEGVFWRLSADTASTDIIADKEASFEAAREVTLASRSIRIYTADLKF